MKSFLLALSIFALAQSSDWKEKARHMEEQYFNVMTICAAKHDVTDEEFKVLEAMEVPVSRREKCISECLLTESGVMAEGRFNRTGSDEISEYLFEEDAENLKIAKTVSKRCEKDVEALKLDDGCETAAETIKCLRRVSKHMGMKEYPDY